MLGKMVHRGPDDWGQFDDVAVHLGMRRLSIVDIDGGKQPMFNRDRSVVVVFNGEVYNAPELRLLLTEKGYPFLTSNSDTEVIAHLYDEYGIGFVEKLVGMFAICLVDISRRELYLIRDRLGKKPIFYTHDAQTKSLQFASEFNALELTDRASHIDRTAFPWFFGQRTLPQESTSDSRVKKLPPGTILRLKDGVTRLDRYYTVRGRSPKESVTDEDACDQLDSILQESVRMRMRADAEVGSYLSGGVDSSLVVALAAQHSARALNTFCLVYDEEIYNKSEDRRFALEISRKFATQHHEVRLTAKDFQDELPKIIAHFGQPYGASVANWFVSRAMFGSVKVALSGDGADELFGSYLLHRVAGALRGSTDPVDPKERELVERAKKEPFDRIIDAFSVFPTEEQELLLVPEMLRQRTCAAEIASRFDSLDSSDPLDRMLEFECRYSLVDVILSYADTLSMAHSIEVRTPFLDHRLVNFAFSLEPRMKIRNGETKFLLKRVAERYLPHELVNRKKEGFIEPAIFWLRDELKEFALATLNDPGFNRLGFLQRPYVRSIVERFYQSNDFYLGKKVWLLVMFGLWEQTFRDG
jgi:asparagine synthase (glutamine-hydrolysing)